jgi:hypothetical protein
LGGGSTLLQDAVTPLDTWLPQWSPPVQRREHVLVIPALILDITQPQWSPPLNGRSTL